LYASVRAHLERLGSRIGEMDLLIAAHALHENLPLVTNNREEFRRVPGLKVESWLR
jgi:tRNA(fMet)-specific endonuclease VapC